MKYIRTKDGRIIVFEPKTKDLDLVAYLSQFANYQGEFAVIKQADTIEELCDEFVSVRDEYHDVWATLNEAVCLCSESDIYGAIWTDKGLIYVAKMNEEGVLCLLG